MFGQIANESAIKFIHLNIPIDNFGIYGALGDLVPVKNVRNVIWRGREGAISDAITCQYLTFCRPFPAQ